jgi:hypothetical protein
MAITIDTSQGNCNTVNPTGSGVAGTTINIVPRGQANEDLTTPNFGNVAFKMMGVNGVTPTIDVNFTGVGHFYFTWEPIENGYFSYDQLTWTLMGNAPNLGTTNHAILSHTSAFTQDTVWFARQRRESAVSISNWITTLNSTYPGRLSYLGGASSFVCGTYATQTDELSRPIAATNLYGFGIKGGHARTIVLVASTHAAEDWGTTVQRAGVEWLLGSDMEAKILLQNFNWVILPVHNAPGREGGHYRGQFDYAGPSVPPGGTGNDFNRHYQDSPAPFPAIDVSRNLLNTELTGTTFSALFDMHTTVVQSDPGPCIWYTSAGSLFSTWSAMMTARIGYNGETAGAYPPGSVSRWSEETKGSSLGVLIEFNQALSPFQTTPTLATQMGKNFLLTLCDMLMQGKFGAAPSARRLN